MLIRKGLLKIWLFVNSVVVEMWRRFSSIDAPVLKKAGIVALSIILICVGLGLFFFGRRQVQEIIGIAILIGILSSLVSSGIFNTFLSRQFSLRAVPLIRFTLIVLTLTIFIVPLTQMTSRNITQEEFLTSIKITFDPMVHGVITDIERSSRGFEKLHFGGNWATILAKHPEIKRHLIDDPPFPYFLEIYSNFLQFSLLAALSEATRPHWFNPKHLEVGESTFSAKYRYLTSEESKGREELITSRNLPFELRKNIFLKDPQLAISLPKGTLLFTEFPSGRDEITWLELRHRLFTVKIFYQSQGCMQGFDTDEIVNNILTESVFEGEPIPKGLDISISSAAKFIHCTGQIWFDISFNKLWAWTSDMDTYVDWINSLQRRMRYLLETPPPEKRYAEETTTLLILKAFEKLNVIQEKLTQLEKVALQEQRGSE